MPVSFLNVIVPSKVARADAVLIVSLLADSTIKEKMVQRIGQL